MDLILDTHALIWFFNGDNLLSEKARRLIEDPKNRKFSEEIKRDLQGAERVQELRSARL